MLKTVKSAAFSVKAARNTHVQEVVCNAAWMMYLYRPVEHDNTTDHDHSTDRVCMGSLTCRSLVSFESL